MSSSEITPAALSLYDKMNEKALKMQKEADDYARREDRKSRGLGMRFNAAALGKSLDEAAPWGLKNGGRHKSRRHRRTRKSRKHKKCRKSRRRH
jgi:hypothetical protein